VQFLLDAILQRFPPELNLGDSQQAQDEGGFAH
jgi:hypothetical protein